MMAFLRERSREDNQRRKTKKGWAKRANHKVMAATRQFFALPGKAKTSESARRQKSMKRANMRRRAENNR